MGPCSPWLLGGSWERFPPRAHWSSACCALGAVYTSWSLESKAPRPIGPLGPQERLMPIGPLRALARPECQALRQLPGDPVDICTG